GFATIYVAKTREVRALNFYGDAPAGATIETFRGKDYQEGYLSPPVPSALKGYADLHAAYGRLPWRQVLQPAVELAEQGFVIHAFLSASLERERGRLSAFPSTARVLYPDGRVPRPGEVFRQPDLARTLKQIAAGGADVFYKGAMPERIGRFFAEHG